ncbi:hypothetical protein G7054_g2538 [Neopestalotiopsis clavispora]|nr:hypothetical protein G7054_g2538 [Neopestalotiopsis clavispora]
MCLVETKGFGVADTLSEAKGPSLRFLEPNVPAARSHSNIADVEAKAYEVSVDTALRPTESFLSQLDSLRTEVNGSTDRGPHRQERDVRQCRNRDCPKFDYTEGNDSLLLKTWIGSYPTNDWGFDHRAKCLGESMFSRVFKFAFASSVRPCDNALCQRRKAALDASAPACSWSAFRDYITTLVACWTPVGLLELLYVRMFCDHSSLLYSQNPCVDLQGAVEVFIWARRIVEGVLPRGIIGLQTLTNSSGASSPDNSSWARSVGQFYDVWRLLTPLHDARGLKYARQCQERGLCPARIWNISLMSPYGVESIFHITNVILPVLDADRIQSVQSQHSMCTDQHCSMSVMNSTLARQAHKCDNEDCGQDIHFSPEALNTTFAQLPKDALTTWYNSAWQIRQGNADTIFSRFFTMFSFLPPPVPKIMRLCDENSGGYMAISHVWSDGTGVGMKRPGSVNRCLFEYFRTIAVDLNCTGIWWDTISLPTSRQARNFALSNMLENYERAKVTLIHDQELANLEWRDDGSPAVALVLSSWFTRGWTAAELWASRNHAVKVVFAHPNKGLRNSSGHEFVLKDLDQDILGWDLSRREPAKPGSNSRWVDVPNDKIPIANFDRPVPVLGHLVATDILALLRQERREERRTTGDLLSDLLQILRPRITSWSIDQMMIAGLLALPSGDFRAEWSEREITQNILISCRSIRMTDLIHGQVPIASRGGRWDWCPPSIFDLGLAYGGSDPSDDKCQISDLGTLSGQFMVFELHEDDQVLPYGSHPAHRARIISALSDRKHHLILTTQFLMRNSHFILFRPTIVNVTSIRGNWIGCCVLQRPPVAHHTLFPGKQGCSFGSPLGPDGNIRPALDIRRLLWAHKIGKRPSTFRPLLAVGVEQDATIVRHHLDKFAYSLKTDTQHQDSVSYLPQLIWIFDPSAKSIYHERDGNIYSIEQADALVTGIAVIDRNVKKNQITHAFASSLPLYVMEEAFIPGSNAINLTWSFPHPIERTFDCPEPRRRIFKSCFEIVPTIELDNENWDILIGQDMFKEEIEPILGFQDVVISNVGRKQHRKHLEIRLIKPCRCHRCTWEETAALDIENFLFSEYPGETD